MDLTAIVALASAIYLYALVSERLAGFSISGPLVFTLLGFVLGPDGFGAVTGTFTAGGVEVLAEATLVIILFSDATRIDLAVLRRQLAIPLRLLLIALPLSVVLGAAVGAALLPGFGLIEAALLAAVLAPTDAALGQAVVTDQRVPVRIRQALNVESGLNDGLMLPAITILLALVGSEASSTTDWISFVARQIGFGLLVGVTVGAVGGRLLDQAAEAGWVEGALRQLAPLALAVGAFAGAEVVEGNGFVAAFVAGLAFGAVAREHCETAADFVEDEGQLLVLLTFFFFGALLVPDALDVVDLRVVAYVVASLTVVRMIPVALSLIALRLEPPTLGYLGWFGPRGLASILFGLFVLEHLESDIGSTILAVVSLTCTVSVVLHGLSAVPLAGRYGRWFASMTDEEMESMEEGVEVEEMRTRTM